jgi:hypothetical protein
MTVTRAVAQRAATQLTRAQARIVLRMQGGEFKDYVAAGIAQRRTRMRLNELGITQPQVIGPVTMYCNVKLSPLGMGVQRLLEERRLKPGATA